MSEMVDPCYRPITVITEDFYMRKAMLTTLLVLLALGAAQLWATPYDKAATVAAMRANYARVGTIKNAVTAGDYFAAAQSFMEYATEASNMMKSDPPKGSKDDWVAIWQAFEDQALTGVGLCATKDSAKVLKALDDLVAINKKGHPEFKG
jgi:hypothetical protein